MTCPDGLFGQFTNVPDGCTFSVSVEGDSDQFIASGDVRAGSAPGAGESLVHSDLCPGPTTRPANDQVIVDVDLLFTVVAQATARVKASVLLPDGSEHQSPYCCEVTGTHGQVFRCTIVATQ
jgi:hypothetical protein